MAGNDRTNRRGSVGECRADARGRRADAVALLARHFGVAGGPGVGLGHSVVAVARDVGRGQGGLASACAEEQAIHEVAPELDSRPSLMSGSLCDSGHSQGRYL